MFVIRERLYAHPVDVSYMPSLPACNVMATSNRLSLRRP